MRIPLDWAAFVMIVLATFAPARSSAGSDEIRASIVASDFQGALDLVETELGQTEDPDERAELIDLFLESMAGLQRADDRVDSLASWALDQKSATSGPHSIGVARTRYQYARWLDYRTRYADALAQCELAISALRELPDAWRDLAHCLDLEMLVLEKQGHLDEALARGEEALSIWEEHGEGDSKEAGRTIGHLARTANRLGSPQQARVLYERSLEILSAHDDVPKADLATARNNLSNILRLLDDLEGATREAELALELYKEGLGAEHPRVALAMGNLANIKLAEAEYAEAERLYEEGLSLSERTLGVDHRQCGVFLYNLGRLQHAMGDEPAAQESYGRTLEIFSASLGPEHPYVSRVMVTRADSWIAEGDFVNAAEAAEQGLEIKRRSLGERHPDVASNLRTIAKARLGLGDFDAAETALAESRSITLDAQGADHTEFALLLRTEARLDEARGDFAGAAAARAEAERILVATTEGFTVEIADLRRKRALSVARQGDLLAATALLDSTLAQQREVHGETHPLIAGTLRSRAAITLAAGDPAGAARDLEDALRRYRNHYGDHPVVAETTAELAIVEHQRGDADRALALALESYWRSREGVVIALRGLGERSALLHAGQQRWHLDLVLSLDASGDDELIQTWEAAASARALVADEMAQRYKTARSGQTPEVQEAWSRLDRARTRLAQLYVQGPQDRDDREYTYALEAARTEKASAERDLARLGAPEGDSSQRPSAFLEGLPPAGLFAAFVQFRKLDLSAPEVLLRGYDGTFRYTAFVAGDSPVRRIDIGPAADVDSMVSGWRQLAQSAPVGLPPQQSATLGATTEAGIRLRRAILDPVFDESTGPVVLVVDGALHLVNFGALPDDDDEPLYSARDVIQIVSSESSSWMEGPGHAPRTGLALGNAAFDIRTGDMQVATTSLRSSTPDCTAFRETHFAPLPASEREVGEVSRAWESAGIQSTVLDGTSASESQLRLDIEGKDIVHLATHAFFTGDSCVGDDVTRDNPLLMSGLVLAGANVRDDVRSGADDGILSAEEISSLDLDDTRWAILSACQTGEGQIQRGEGVFGLRRAFQLAGCEGLVLTLWPVEDSTTARWMELFYESFFALERDAAAAVSAASLALRAERESAGLSTHPFYWGGFVYSGTR